MIFFLSRVVKGETDWKNLHWSQSLNQPATKFRVGPPTHFSLSQFATFQTKQWKVRPDTNNLLDSWETIGQRRTDVIKNLFRIFFEKKFKIKFENFLIFLHHRLIHPKNGNSEEWIVENWIFSSGHFDFRKIGYFEKVDLSKMWIF